MSEMRCGDCGRDLMPNEPCSGFIAACGRRVSIPSDVRICETIGLMRFGPDGDLVTERKPDLAILSNDRKPE
jgi:hypothetical protein